MSQTTITPAPPTTGEPSKIDQTHKALGIVSTSLGIAGAIGTVFVGLAMNFYVGDVEVQPDRPLDAALVKVYDNKGHEAVYHTMRFQLMPGDYSLDIIPAGGAAIHADARVVFNRKAVIPVVVPAPTPTVQTGSDSESDESKSPPGKHWWQFWRR